MALNPSGPISLGGATVGQSINLELGQSATATISLNDTNARALAGVPSGTISLSNFYGKSNITYFITVYSGGVESVNNRSIGVDSSGNIYSGPYDNLSGLVNKLPPAGTPISYAKYINTASITSTRILPISDGSSFIGGENQIVVPRGSGLARLTSTGTISWVNELSSGGGGTSTGGRTEGLAVDPSGNLYARQVNYTSNGSAYWQYIAKYNGSTGANIWSIQYFYQSFRGMGLAVDTSGNCYFGNAVSSVFYLMKADTNGTITLTRSVPNAEWFSAGVYAGQGTVTTLYTPGGAVIAGLIQNGGSRLVKFTTGFDITWAVQVVNPSGSCTFDGTVSSDASDNYYVTGWGNSGGYTYGTIFKFNSAGTLQWQRRIRSSGWPSDTISMQVGSVRVGNTSDIIYLGIGYNGNSGDRRSIVAGFPADGSKTGTYTVGGITIVYEAISFTVSTLSLTTPTTVSNRTQSTTETNFNTISNSTSDSGYTISNTAI